MPDNFRRKTPQQAEKRKPKQSPLPPNTADLPALSEPDWLPNNSDSFVAWSAVVERARQEHSACWRAYYVDQGDKRLAQAEENASRLVQLVYERAYPPGFWEGLEAMQSGETDHLETYILFLEADPYFYGTGYAKSYVIRGLKRLPLTDSQRDRLQNVVLNIVDNGFRREFRDYCRLARHVQTPAWLDELRKRLTSQNRLHAVRARLVIEACEKK